MIFKNRSHAAKLLYEKLKKYQNDKNSIIIALPRGGVVIGKELSTLLSIPLDVIIPRKIKAPFYEELAIGAICKDISILNNSLIKMLNIKKEYIQEEISKEKEEALRRENLYRKDKTSLNVENKNIIIVDDGIATGATMEASIKYLYTKNPKKIIVAIPVAPEEIIDYFKKMASEVIVLFSPFNFMAVGQFYEEFKQVEDEEVIKMLKN